MRVVIDCNILISAGFTDGTCRAAIRKAISVPYQPVLSPAILKEWQEVASRPKFSGISDYLAELLLEIAQVADFVYPDESGFEGVLPDEKDVPYLLAALESGAGYLVIGNLKDFPPEACVGITVITAGDFVKNFEGGQGNLY